MRRQSVGRLLGLFLALLLFSGVIGAYFILRAPQGETRASISVPNARAVTIPIAGMTCAACVARVKRALASIPGVVEVEVSLARRDARVRYVEGKVSFEHLRPPSTALATRLEPRRPGG